MSRKVDFGSDGGYDLWSILRLKFTKDVIWTGASGVVLGFAGILINLLIVKHYGTEGLGIFTFAFSIYIIVGIFCLFGIANSLVNLLPENRDKEDEFREIVSSGAMLVAGFSALFTAASILSSPLFRFVKQGEMIESVFIALAPALPFVSINKYLAGLLNALRRMKAYALTNVFRFILASCFVAISSVKGNTLTLTAYSFVLTELLLFLFLVIHLRIWNYLAIPRTGMWFKRHLGFSKYVFSGEVAGMINIRIDNILIGSLMGSAPLGIYAFAAEIVKGLAVFANAIQLNLNPVISDLWTKKNLDAMRNYLWRVIKNTQLFYGFLFVSAVPVYVGLARLVAPEVLTTENFICYTILLVALCSSSGSLAVLGVLSYCGRAQHYLYWAFSGLLVNIVGNLILIPIWGIVGAAASTGIAYIVMAVYLYWFISRHLGIDLFRGNRNAQAT